MLALLLLFSETATAFAADVSGSEAGPFSLSEEQVLDVSEDDVIDVVSDEITENVYEDSEPTFTFSEGDYKAVYYYGLETDVRNNSFMVKSNAIIQPENSGSVMFFDYGTAGTWTAAATLANAVDKEEHKPVKADANGYLPVGEYLMPLTKEVSSVEYTGYFPFEVKSLDSIEEIKSTTPKEGAGLGYHWYKLATSDGQVYKPKLEFNNYLGSWLLEEYYFDENGKVQLEAQGESRLPGADGRTYYILVRNDSDDGFILSIEQGKLVTGLSIDKGPAKTQFYYGVENIWNGSFDGLKLKGTYKDGSEEILEVRRSYRGEGLPQNTDFFEYKIVNSTTGETIERDSAGYYPVGSYTAKISVDGNTVAFPIEIISLDYMPLMSTDPDYPVSLSAEGASPKYVKTFFKLDVEAGNTYNITFSDEKNSHAFIDEYVVYRYNAPHYDGIEVKGDNKNISFTANSTETLYLSFRVFTECNVYAKKLRTISSLKLEKTPSEDRYYAYFTQNITPYGAELYASYMDGLIGQTIKFDELAENGISSYLIDDDGDRVNIVKYNGFYGYPSGNYTLLFDADGAGTGYPVTIKSWDDIPKLEVGKSEVLKASMYYVKDKNGSTVSLRFVEPIYKMHLDPGDYAITSNEFTSVSYIYDSQGNKLTGVDSRFEKTHYFTISKTGDYYASLQSADNTTITLKGGADVLKPVEIIVGTQPVKRTFLYGFDDPDMSGYSICVKYSNGTYSDNFEYFSDRCPFDYSVKTISGDEAWNIRDENGRLPVGRYFWHIYAKGAESVYKDIVFEVVPAKMDATLVLGKEQSLECNMRKSNDGYYSYYFPFDEKGNPLTPYLLAVDLEKGESYQILNDSAYGSIQLFGPDYYEIGYGNKGLNFTAEKSGTHYLKVYTSGGKVSVSSAPGLVYVTVEAGIRENIIFVGENESQQQDIINSWFVKGIELFLEYDNGDRVWCEQGDQTWTDLSISYSNDLNKILPVDPDDNYNGVLEAGKEYYIPITIPCYDGTIANAKDVRFSVASKADRTLKSGDKITLSTDDAGRIRGFGVYYLDVEAGKTYRIKSDCYINVSTGLSRGDYVGGIYGHAPMIYTADKNDILRFEIRDDSKFEKKPIITVDEVAKPISASVTTAPSKLQYEYGILYPKPEGVVITVKTENDDQVIKYDQFEQYGVRWEFIDADTNKAPKYDSKNNAPKGKYYFRYKIPGIGNYDDTKNEITIGSADPNYKVVFNSNYPIEVSKPDAKVTKTYSTNKIVTLAANSFKCPGYRFCGWADAPNGSVEYVDKATVENLAGEADSVDLYAVWQLERYSIKWHLEGGAFESGCEGPTEYTINSSKIELPIPEALKTMTGFTFAGWYTGTDYRTEAKAIDAGSTGNRDFYAKWTLTDYTVRFNGNGNTKGGSTKDVKVYYGVDIPLTKNGFKSDAAFLGWALFPTGEVKYADKASINIKDCLSDVKEGKILDLYAVWQKDFEITYETDGGTFSGECPTYYTYGSKFDLPKPTKAGYTFAGWYKDAEFKTKIDKITKTTSGHLVLTAKWTPITYTLKFDSNGGSGKIKNITAKYEDKVMLPDRGSVKKGYRLVGWTRPECKATAATIDSPEGYLDFQENYPFFNTVEIPVKQLITSGKTISLAAVWVKCDYYAYFVTYGGSSITPIMYHYNGKGEAFELPAPPEKDGYTFDGWYLDDKFTKKLTTTKGLYGSISIYAKWKADYVVSFDKAAIEATGTMESKTFTFNKAEALPKNGFTRTGYVFMGWDTDPSADEVVFADKEKITGIIGKPSITLYAVWRKEFNLIYNVNGGSLPYGYITSYTYGDSEVVLPTPVKGGYTFGGWYTDAKFKKKASIKATTYGDVELFAKWTGSKFTVVFDGNGGKGKMKKQSFTYGTAKALTKNSFKKKGYTFKGWSFYGNGPVEYTDAVKLSDKYSPAINAIDIGSYKETIWLYAVWEKDIYTISYDMGGVIPNPDNDARYEHVYSIGCGYTLPEPERIGYTFLGYYSDKKFKKKVTGIKPTDTGNKTFYAKWKINK